MQTDKVSILDLPFKDKLFRFAYNIVGNVQDAEDIMQELLIKIWNRQEQYSGLDNKEAWCMTVTRNLAIDKVRSRKINTKDIDEFHHIRDHDHTQDKQMEADESLKFVMDLVNDLPEKQRMIIHLRDVEGYSYKEIAEMMDTSLDFVKVSLHRARKSLKDELLKRNFKKYDT